jgi:hypothetical protein
VILTRLLDVGGARLASPARAAGQRVQAGGRAASRRADLPEEVDPHDFRKAVALLGVMGFVLADMPETLGGK